jgi:hypothetical protein
VVDEAIAFGWVIPRAQARRTPLAAAADAAQAREQLVAREQERVARLIAAGTMTKRGWPRSRPPSATAPGRLDAVEQLIEPDDLAPAPRRRSVGPAPLGRVPALDPRGILE